MPTTYERKVTADMERTVLLIAADLKDLIAELRAVPLSHRRQAVGEWLRTHPILAAMVVDSLASFCADLVEIADARTMPKAWPPR